MTRNVCVTMRTLRKIIYVNKSSIVEILSVRVNDDEAGKNNSFFQST